MWDKAKELLRHGLNVVLAIILLLGAVSYVSISSILVTDVINDLRLGTYVDISTGFGIVLLVLLLGWGPVWIMRTFRTRR